MEIIPCPACARKLHLADAGFGQSVQCPRCGHTFVAAPPAAVAPLPMRSKRLAVYDDDLDIERRVVLDDYEPHRGPLIHTLGLISLVGGLLFGIPMILGPVVWFLASRDLRAMADGHMNPKGLHLTRIGRSCGIGASVLLMLVLAFVALALLGG